MSLQIHFAELIEMSDCRLLAVGLTGQGNKGVAVGERSNKVRKIGLEICAYLGGLVALGAIVAWIPQGYTWIEAHASWMTWLAIPVPLFLALFVLAFGCWAEKGDAISPPPSIEP